MAIGRAEAQLAHSPRLVAGRLEHLRPCSDGPRVKSIHVVDPEVGDIAVIAKLACGGNVRAAAKHEGDLARATEAPIAWVNIIGPASEHVAVPRTGPIQVMNRQNRRRSCDLHEIILLALGRGRFALSGASTE